MRFSDRLWRRQPIDTAKAIKILTANPGRAVDYAGVGKVRHPGVPLVAINTTAGTAAEATSNAVITDSARQIKQVIIDAHLILISRWTTLP